jgi:hypothetical protein
MGEACSMHGGDVGGLRGGDHLEDLVVDERIILQFFLVSYNWRVWIGLIWLRIGTGVRLL